MPSTPANARRTKQPAHEVERRLYVRYPFILNVDYKLLATGSGEQIGVGKTVNLSGRGVLFEATDALPARTLVEITIDWPFVKEEGSDAPKLVMRGRVVRTDSKLVAVRVSRSEFHF